MLTGVIKGKKQEVETTLKCCCRLKCSFVCVCVLVISQVYSDFYFFCSACRKKFVFVYCNCLYLEKTCLKGEIVISMIIA